MGTADEDRIQLRRAEVLRLRIRGYTVREIATELGHPKSTVGDDLKAAMSETLTRTQEEIDAERELELHRIDAGLRVVAKILHDREVTAEEAKRLDISVDELLASHDELKLKALDRQVKLQEQRAKLLGLYAPSKVESTVSGNLTIDELEKLRAVAEENAR